VAEDHFRLNKHAKKHSKFRANGQSLEIDDNTSERNDDSLYKNSTNQLNTVFKREIERFRELDATQTQLIHSKDLIIDSQHTSIAKLKSEIEQAATDRMLLESQIKQLKEQRIEGDTEINTLKRMLAQSEENACTAKSNQSTQYISLTEKINEQLEHIARLNHKYKASKAKVRNLKSECRQSTHQMQLQTNEIELLKKHFDDVNRQRIKGLDSLHTDYSELVLLKDKVYFNQKASRSRQANIVSRKPIAQKRR
jgi:chromosome segregation ATPase